MKSVGVFGATSFVGTSLLPLLTKAGFKVTTFSRKTTPSEENIPSWISLAPIWILPEYFYFLENRGIKRLVVLSSTSRFTKEDLVAHQIIESEKLLEEWANKHGVEWIILRPTLIYGYGQDKNISEITRFIKRFYFFPIFGQAKGLRQPIHVDDVAGACFKALQEAHLKNRAYNISGAEILSYRQMVARVFNSLNMQPRFLSVPLWAFSIAVFFMRFIPRYQSWSPAMAERMNRDMVFEHNEAMQDLGFEPRKFEL